MAVYDGFFDAVADEETGEFDRAYGSGDFTDYFAHIIGSGVCIHNDPDSFKVRFENGIAVVSPGYLFIQGYWLKNDSDYSISVTGTATLAVVAHLNLGKRMIELEARSIAQAYPDSLVLSLVNPAAGTAEDTRHNTDICGIIDTAGELSKKVEWAVNYIDNEIEDKLAAAEADIAEQSKKLDSKIAEVQAQVDNITPPPVGTIQFSASQDVGPEWLPCNGDFVSESQYPELVAALGKLTPSGDKFKLLSEGEIGPQISNGVVYGGRMWVYSYSTGKLYGVDLEGESPVKEITVTSEDTHFSNFLVPTTANPITLSIVLHKVGTGAKLFLGQYLVDSGGTNGDDYDWMKLFLLFQTEFAGSETALDLSPAFVKAEASGNYRSYRFYNVVPYVTSKLSANIEKYYIPGVKHTNGNGPYCPLVWVDGENAVNTGDTAGIGYDEIPDTAQFSNQRYAFSKKNKGEMVALGTSGTFISSILNGTFNFSRASGTYTTRTSILPLNVVGGRGVIASFTPTNFPVVRSDGRRYQAWDFPPLRRPCVRGRWGLPLGQGHLHDFRGDRHHLLPDVGRGKFWISGHHQRFGDHYPIWIPGLLPG